MSATGHDPGTLGRPTDTVNHGSDRVRQVAWLDGASGLGTVEWSTRSGQRLELRDDLRPRLVLHLAHLVLVRRDVCTRGREEVVEPSDLVGEEFLAPIVQESECQTQVAGDLVSHATVLGPGDKGGD